VHGATGRTIIEGGEPGRVVAMRQDFQRLMERRYRETIEAITGRRVVAFLSQAHLEPDITLEIFFLDRPMNGAAAPISTCPRQIAIRPRTTRDRRSCRACESSPNRSGTFPREPDNPHRRQKRRSHSS
jgi:hypothetical protein